MNEDVASDFDFGAGKPGPGEQEETRGTEGGTKLDATLMVALEGQKKPKLTWKFRRQNNRLRR